MRVVITLLLLIAATPAWAEWMKVSETNVTVHYIDIRTIIYIGQMRRVWVIQDLKKRDPDGELSMRMLNEYDCAEKRWRTLSLSTHSGPMAGGRSLVSGNIPSEWSYLPSGTTSGVLIHRIVCAS